MGHCASKSTYKEPMHEDLICKLPTDCSAAEQKSAAEKLPSIVVSSPGHLRNDTGTERSRTYRLSRPISTAPEPTGEVKSQKEDMADNTITINNQLHST